jgi:predicted metal-binding membrane protein
MASVRTAPDTTIESLLKRDRWVTLAVLLIVIGICWAWIVSMSQDMYGAMTGAAAWMMTPRWDWTEVLLLFAMWSVMMVGMMLPSVAPTLLLYGALARRTPEPLHVHARVYAFAVGYLVIWTLFSAAATTLQRLLSDALVLSPMMQLVKPAMAGAVLVVAGIYQLTPLKYACLTACRAPHEFLTRAWRPGVGGAFLMGLKHGCYCLGCCCALMLLLFAGGVMNLLVIGTLTVLVLIEKLAPFGGRSARFSGVLLIALGAWMLVTR